MAVIQRITDFIPNTLIVSQEVDDEFNQLVNLLSGVSDDNDTILRYNHATDPVLNVDQLGAGDIQEWLQNGTVKARVGNDGTIGTPALVHPSGSGQVVIKGYPYTLEVNTTTVGNVGTGLDTLHSYSLAANKLAANGDYVRHVVAGAFAANDDNKRVFISFGGQTVEDTGLIDIDGQGWKAIIEYTRLSTTTVLASAAILLGFLQFDSAGASGGSGGRYISRTTTLTVADVTANATTLLVQAESATASNDNIVQRLTSVEIVQR